MPAANPQTTYSSLIEKINSLLEAESYSEIQFASLEREAQQLKRVHPAQGYTVLGILACLRDNETELRRCHELALTYSRSSETLLHFANSLVNCGKREEGFAILEEAYAIDPLNKTILQYLIFFSHSFMWTQKYSAYTQQWENLHGSPFDTTNLPITEHDMLRGNLDIISRIMASHPGLVEPADAELIALADELVQGVETE